MEKNMMMPALEQTPGMRLKAICQKSVWQKSAYPKALVLKGMWKTVLDLVKAPVVWLRAYYSSVCGKELTMGQTALLINTQAAFLVTALPADMPIIARLACCVWLVGSLRECKRKI